MKVSVSIVTYNHEVYIAQAIESVLMQKTSFDYEILIGEDDSTDRTREIVKDYKRRYPDKIKLFLNDRKNVIYINGKPTGRWNLINNLTSAQGEYLALLEGDDYWTDPNKLEKQVRFMDSHPDYALCFHPVTSLDEGSGKVTLTAPRVIKPYYTLDDLLCWCNFINTASVLYRNNLDSDLPAWYLKVPMGDFPLHILNAQRGKIGFIDEAMSVYRLHAGGWWSQGHDSIEKSEMRLEAYLLIGQGLDLLDRASYEAGVTACYQDIYTAYGVDGKMRQRLKAGFQLFHRVPCGRKIPVLIGMFVPYRVSEHAKRLYEIIRYEGPKAFFLKVYSKAVCTVSRK